MAQIEAQVLPTGAQIGVYEIKEVISSGRAGILYRAWNEHLNTMVALKEYLPVDYAVRDDDGKSVKAKRINDASVYEYGKEKFLEFAEILTDIQHPNVVGVHNVLQFNGTAYLAMDFEEGVPLSKLQASSPAFTETELKAMFVSLLSALQAVHEKETVHGDVHPSNIIIKQNGEPVLVNFAAARLALAAHTKELLQELRPGYAPSELYHPNNLPGPSSDLYSLGATMYYCITRTDPGSILDRVEALNNNQPDPYLTNLEKKGADFSERLLKPIGWMLHHDAEKRPQSAPEVLAMLNQDADLSKIPEMKYRKAPASVEEKALATDTSETSTGLLIPALIGIAVLIAAGLWFIQKEHQQPELLVTKSEQESEKPVVEPAEPVSVAPEQTVESIEAVEVAPEETEEEIKMAQAPGIAAQESDESQLEDTLKQTTPTSVESATEAQSEQPQTITSDTPEPTSTEDSEDLSEVAATSSAPEEESITPLQEPIESEPVLDSEDQTVPLSDDQIEKINEHLTAAEKNLAELHLTTPLDDNAYINYQAVLQIDPDNIPANEGLKRIIEMYTWFIEDAIAEGRYNSAQVYLNRAEATHPDAPELQRLRNELNHAMQ